MQPASSMLNASAARTKPVRISQDKQGQGGHKSLLTFKPLRSTFNA